MKLPSPPGPLSPASQGCPGQRGTFLRLVTVFTITSSNLGVFIIYELCLPVFVYIVFLCYVVVTNTIANP